MTTPPSVYYEEEVGIPTENTYFERHSEGPSHRALCGLDSKLLCLPLNSSAALCKQIFMSMNSKTNVDEM